MCQINIKSGVTSMDLRELNTELRVLVDEMEKNFSQKKYGGYEHFIEEYNRFLEIGVSQGIESGAKKVAFLDQGKKGMYGGISSEEVAKCNELAYEAKKLLSIVNVKTLPLVQKTNAIQIVESIANNFHNVVKQLRVRYGERNTLDVDDEYDVQDLLHALLKLYFDDIRSEEWTPSYAGGCKRMDFLLKKEKVVIEVKKTRKGLSDKEVGEQLIIDIGTYQAHPDCKTLICFVYDPEGRIGNPVGLESDLNKLSNGNLTVKTLIIPK